MLEAMRAPAPKLPERRSFHEQGARLVDGTVPVERLQSFFKTDPAVVEDSAERFVCLEAQGVEEEEHAMWTDQHESRLFIALLSVKGNWHSLSVAAVAANNLRERAVALMSKQVGVVCCPKKTKAASQG